MKLDSYWETLRKRSLNPVKSIKKEPGKVLLGVYFEKLKQLTRLIFKPEL
jgi:hypothetical protein